MFVMAFDSITFSQISVQALAQKTQVDLLTFLRYAVAHLPNTLLDRVLGVFRDCSCAVSLLIISGYNPIEYLATSLEVELRLFRNGYLSFSYRS